MCNTCAPFLGELQKPREVTISNVQGLEPVKGKRVNPYKQWYKVREKGGNDPKTAVNVDVIEKFLDQ